MGCYDPSKLLKIGISYGVTSSPKIASNMQGWPKKWYDRVHVALLLPLERQKGDEWHVKCSSRLPSFGCFEPVLGLFWAKNGCFWPKAAQIWEGTSRLSATAPWGKNPKRWDRAMAETARRRVVVVACCLLLAKFKGRGV